MKAQIEDTNVITDQHLEEKETHHDQKLSYNDIEDSSCGGIYQRKDENNNEMEGQGNYRGLSIRR